MMKPLIIGMGPSPDPRYEGGAWFPLAPASRSLSKLIFDRWTGFPDVERAFELSNLNQKCHRKTSGNRARDCVDPSEAAATIARLLAEGVFEQDRVIFLLGSEVARYVQSRAPRQLNARLVALPHPSILCTPWNWPRPGDGSWRATMRNALRASIGLPAMDYAGAADDAPELLWNSFDREDWLGYAKRYGLRLSKAEWLQLIAAENKRPDIREATILIAEPELDTTTEHGQQTHDLLDDMEDWSRSNDEGWFHSDEN